MAVAKGKVRIEIEASLYKWLHEKARERYPAGTADEEAERILGELYIEEWFADCEASGLTREEALKLWELSRIIEERNRQNTGGSAHFGGEDGKYDEVWRQEEKNEPFLPNVKVLTAEQVRLALANPFIHVDYSPEWHEKMRKASEGVRFIFEPDPEPK